jgi:hypothetical protein
MPALTSAGMSDPGAHDPVFATIAAETAGRAVSWIGSNRCGTNPRTVCVNHRLVEASVFELVIPARRGGLPGNVAYDPGAFR